MLIDTPTSFLLLRYAEKMAARGNLDATYEEDAWTYLVEPAARGRARVLVYDEDGILIGAP